MVNYQDTGLSNSYVSRKVKVNYIIIFTFALFFLNDTVRSILSNWYYLFNIPFLVAGIFMVFKFGVVKGQVRPFMLFVVTCFSSVLLVQIFFLDTNKLYIGLTLINMVLPLFLMAIRLEADEALSSLHTFLKYFNILILLILFLGIIDYVSGSALQLFFARTIFAGKELGNLILTEHSVGIYRYYSLIGHPLTNAKYFLFFFVLNSIYAKYRKPIINPYLVSLITMLGLILSGSKTALILGIILLIFFGTIKKYRGLYIFIITICTIIFLNTSLFQENLKQRYVQGADSGDLTSGRNVLIDLLFERGADLPHLFIGGGTGYSRVVAKSLNGAITNFEYPSIMLAYDYSIVGMLLLYFCLFIYPTIIFIQKKMFYTLYLFWILVVMINTNNGLANIDSDYLSSFCIITLMLMNLEKAPTERFANKQNRINLDK